MGANNQAEQALRAQGGFPEREVQGRHFRVSEDSVQARDRRRSDQSSAATRLLQIQRVDGGI